MGAHDIVDAARWLASIAALGVVNLMLACGLRATGDGYGRFCFSFWLRSASRS